MTLRTAFLLLAVAALTGGVARAPDLTEQQRRLATAKREEIAAAARAERLRRSARTERDAATRTASEERALAARVTAAQAGIETARARVVAVEILLDGQRARLGTAQAPVARLLAALQSLARRPAAAAIARPGSVDDLVHLRAVLGGTLPVVAARTAIVRDELERTRRLQRSAALAARALRDGRARLMLEQTALARAEARHRARATALGRGALTESDRAIALGERARLLVDTMAADARSDTRGDVLEALPAPSPRPVSTEAITRDEPSRVYRLPMTGRLDTGFDAVSSAGVRSRGLRFLVRPGAGVVAPAAGTVRYARAYRGYGIVVIVDHGASWSTTILGLGTTQVRVGDAIEAGDPVGTALTGDSSAITVELRRRGRPVDLAALL